MDNIIDFLYNKDKIYKERMALDLEITLRLIFVKNIMSSLQNTFIPLEKNKKILYNITPSKERQYAKL